MAERDEGDMEKNKLTRPTITLCWVVSILWLPAPIILKTIYGLKELSVGFFLIYMLPYWIFLMVVGTYNCINLKTYIRKNYPDEEELKAFDWTIITFYHIYRKYKGSSDIELKNRAVKVIKAFRFTCVMLLTLLLYSIIFLSI